MSERTSGQLVLGGEPRVNLLPPEVHDRARGARARRGLVFLVILALVVAIGATVAATLNAGAASSSLAAAQQKTAVILGQRQKYASAETLTKELATVQATEVSAGGSDVLWSDIYTKISTMLPDGTAIVAGTLVAPTAWEPVAPVLGPLRLPHVASLTLILRSKTPQDAATLLPELTQLPQYADATLDAVAYNKTADNYFTQYTVELNDKARSGRFTSGSASK